MKSPEVIIISEEELVLPSTKQVYYNVGRKNKIWALCRVLDKDKPKAIVFCSTKRMVDILDQRLKSYGYPVEALHGDLSQAQRERVLTDFRKGKIKVLIATDVAARGLDIEDVTLVINYDIPESPEWYVHRVGRTGRAGKEGKAITFVSSDEKHLLEGIKEFGKGEIEQAEVPTTGEKDVVRKVWDFDEYVDIYGMVMFRIDLGKADKFGMNDVIELIRIRAEISEIAIGHVEIGETSSEFEIHKEVAYKAMKILDQSRFRGKTISIEPVPRAK
jgi:ATP-dependent RNA helicase DeaD